MRFRLLAAALGVVFLALTGLRPGTLPYTPFSTYSDATISHFPAALFLRQAVLERGEFPLWRDTLLGGQPFAANPLNKTAYPLQWLALLFPADIHLDVMAVLHLLIAGWGMARWARSLGLSDGAATLSGLAYALGPRMIAHLGAGHLDVVYALAWWPWLMDAVHSSVERSDRRLIVTLRLGLLAALVLLSDVRVALFAFVLAAAYGLYTLTRTRRWRVLPWLSAAVVPFLLLTVSLLLPLLGWQSFLTRGDVTAHNAGVYSMTPVEWGSLFGLPFHGGSQELQTYVGLTVLILALIAVAADRRRHAFFLAAMLAAALWALGENGFLWSAAVRLIPALLWFRVPSRAWLVVALLMPLLAGYGVQALQVGLSMRRPAAEVRRARLGLVILLVASATSGAALLIVPLPIASNTTVAVTFLVGGALTAVILLLAVGGRLRGSSLLPALLLVTFADLGWNGLSWLTWRGPTYWRDPYIELADRLAAEHPARVYAPIYATPTHIRLSLPQEVAALDGLRLFGGVDPFQMRAPASAIIAAGGMISSGYDVALPLLPEPAQGQSAPAPDTRLLGQWDVSHVVSVFPIDAPRLQADGVVKGTYVYLNLDFTPSARTGIPDWPPDAPYAPDAATMERLNRLTMISAAVSGTAFIVVVAVLVVDGLRRRGMKAALS